MDIRMQKLFAWGGLLSLLMAVGGQQMAGLMPPPSPAASADQIAVVYRAHSEGILRGSMLYLLSVAPFLMFVGVLSVQLRRVEGERRTFTYLQIIAGTASMAPLIIIPLAWSVAAFRPDQSAQTIRAFNDLAFITLAMSQPIVAVEMLAVGLAILANRSTRLVFPKWFAYFNLLCALGLMPGLLCVLSKEGPLAWNGVAGLLPPLFFIPWTLVTMFMLLRAIKQEEAEGASRLRLPEAPWP